MKTWQTVSLRGSCFLCSFGESGYLIGERKIKNKWHSPTPVLKTITTGASAPSSVRAKGTGDASANVTN